MVYHVMNDGTVKTDITGHVVKIKDAEPVYRLINDMENRSRKKEVVKNDVSRQRAS